MIIDTNSLECSVAPLADIKETQSVSVVDPGVPGVILTGLVTCDLTEGLGVRCLNFYWIIMSRKG